MFTTLDYNLGYWKVPVEPADKPKTAFTQHCKTFQYTRIPFGFMNAPATFQQTLDVLFSSFKWNSVIVYINDVVIYSNDV